MNVTRSLRSPAYTRFRYHNIRRVNQIEFGSGSLATRMNLPPLLPICNIAALHSLDSMDMLQRLPPVGLHIPQCKAQ
jgi:hypothetical protein